MLAVPDVCALRLMFFRNFQFTGRFKHCLGFALDWRKQTNKQLQDISSTVKLEDSATQTEIWDRISAIK